MKPVFTIRKNTLIFLIFVIISIMIGIFLIKKEHKSIESSDKTMIQNETLVTNGIKAFFTIDYANGFDNWLENFCAASSESGCDIVRNIYGPAFWVFIEEHHFSTNCTVEVGEVVEEGEDYQVWKSFVTFSPPFPNQSTTQTVYSLLLMQPDENWKFERILTDQEAKIYE